MAPVTRRPHRVVTSALHGSMGRCQHGPRPRTPVSQRALLIEGMLVVTQPVTPPRPALSSVGVRETAMRRLASVRETSVRHNVTGSFEPGISSGCFVTHQIRRK
jgi:hypothetical protein